MSTDVRNGSTEFDEKLQAAAWFVACASSLSFGWTLWRYVHGIFAESLNSDAAVPVLLAGEILRTAKFVPASWYYGNDDLWIISPQLLALPFVAWFGATPVALLASDIVGVLLMVAAATLLARRLGLGLPQAITVALGLAGLYSALQRDVVYTQIAYGWITTKLLFLLYLLLRIASRADLRARDFLRWDVAVYMALLLLLVAESPSRAGIYWCIPVTALCLIGNPLRCSRRLAIALLGMTAAASFAGVVMHFALRPALVAAPGLSFALRPLSTWPHSVGVLWDGLPLLIGTGVSTWMPAWSGVAILVAVRAVAMATAATYVVGTVMPAKTNETALASAKRVAAVMLLGTGIVLSIGTLAVGPSSVRYLIPPLFVSMLTMMAGALHAMRRRARTSLAATVVFAFGFSGGAVLFASASVAPARPAASCIAPGGVCSLQRALQKLPVKQGFSTYWNAGVTTLSSSGTVSVCAITVRPRPLPYRWLTSTECFDPARYAEGYFIVLSDAEAQSVDPTIAFAETGSPQQTVHDAGVTIWVFGASAPIALEWLQH